jgi:predicted DNA-binding protein with PD1-like motif
MKSKLLNESGDRTYALIFETGEEPLSGITRFAEEHNLSASRITAIGALSEVVLGFFDWEKKDYERIELKEQVEVLALVGDIALDQGKPKVHAHLVVGLRDGRARGGHLLEAKVRPTLDKESGLALIKIG